MGLEKYAKQIRLQKMHIIQFYYWINRGCIIRSTQNFIHYLVFLVTAHYTVVFCYFPAKIKGCCDWRVKLEPAQHLSTIYHGWTMGWFWMQKFNRINEQHFSIISFSICHSQAGLPFSFTWLPVLEPQSNLT
jgi:hypothetical protein